MPIYEYECSGCQKIHEVMQKFSDAPMTECPDCGKPVQKKMSLTTFALKGAGWYTTDYKKTSGPSVTSKPSAPAAAPAAAPTPPASTTNSSSSGTSSGG